MADKRISGFPAATQWHPDAFIPQDNPAGLTEKVTPAQVEAKLEADGFVKAASPSLGQVAAYTAGGWAPIKLADANIDAAAAIGWGKVSKTGAVATDVGALPEIVVTGAVDLNSVNASLPCSAEINASAITNGPSGLFPTGGRAHLLQGKCAANYITQILTVSTPVAIVIARNMTGPGAWGAWRVIWDDALLPAGATGKNVLAASTQSAARSAISALPIANPTATGTLTAPTIVVSGLAGSGSRVAGINSAGQIVAAMYTAKDCLNITTTAPTAAPNYVRANSYTGGLDASASYRGSLKGHIDAGSVLDVRFTIGGAQSSAGNQLTSEQTGDFVLQWWLETYASGQDAILNFQMATWPGSTFKQFGLMHTFPAPTLGGSDDLKIELKIGNTSVAVRTMSEILERIA